MSTKFNGTDSATPCVSIGMPVYNGEAHVREAIESILAQTFTDFELIIGDNCSEDSTPRICREYAEGDKRVRYFRHQSNLGASKNFTFVFDQARGEYFKWAAHDDVIAPSYLQRCVEILDQCGPNVVLCGPQRLLMSYDGHVLGPDPKARWFETSPPFDRISFARLMRVNAFLHPILGLGLMRRAVLAKTRLIGGYNYSDLVLVAEMRLLGEFRQIVEPLSYTRMHAPRTQKYEVEMLDPSNSGKTPWPEFRLFWERLKSVHRLGGPWYKKPWYYACVIYGNLVVRSLDVACWQKRKIEAPIWKWWERVSTAWIRRSGKNYSPHRIWIFLSGLRNRDKEKLTLAVARTTPHTEKALIEFVALKLGRRQDPYSREVLNDWLNGPCPIRKSAAARALSVHPIPKQ